MISVTHEVWDEYFDACHKQEALTGGLRRGWHTELFCSASNRCLDLIRSISVSDLPKAPPTDIERAIIDNPGISVRGLARMLKVNLDTIRTDIRNLPSIEFISQDATVGMGIRVGDSRRYRYMGQEDRLKGLASSWNKWFGNVDPYTASLYVGMGIDKLQRICAELGLVRKNAVINHKSVVVYRKERKGHAKTE